MGTIVSITCTNCGYESGEFALGRGMFSSSDKVLGVCSACRRFTTMEGVSSAASRRLKPSGQDPVSAAEQEEPPGDCALCQTEGSVRPVADAAFSGWYRMHWCPQCGEFTAREQLLGLWD